MKMVKSSVAPPPLLKKMEKPLKILFYDVVRFLFICWWISLKWLEFICTRKLVVRILWQIARLVSFAHSLMFSILHLNLIRISCRNRSIITLIWPYWVRHPNEWRCYRNEMICFPLIALPYRLGAKELIWYEEIDLEQMKLQS